MDNYRELDINQRINLKGLLSAWTDITIDRFQAEIEAKVYNRKRSGKARKLRRSRQLKQSWRQQKMLASAGSGINRINISFLMYGRFDDMGVGKGTDYALSKYQQIRKNGERRTRRPSRWYSKRKGFEQHRLRELLSRYYVNVPIDLIENALSTQVTVDL